MNTNLVEKLVAALREELVANGEFLARLDDLRRNGPKVTPAQTRAIEEQRQAIRDCRCKRERLQQRFVGSLHLPDHEANPFRRARRLPAGYRLLLGALAEENDDLLRRVQAAPV